MTDTNKSLESDKTEPSDRSALTASPPQPGDGKEVTAESGVSPGPDPKAVDQRAEMQIAVNNLKGILLPASFGGFGVTFDAPVPRFERPANQCWFRTHPTAYFDVLAFKGQDGKTLFVAEWTNEPLVGFLSSRNAGRPVRCYPYTYLEGVLGFWPVMLDGTNGRLLDSWNRSAHVIAESGKSSWRAIIPGADQYKDAKAPEANGYAEPKWPEDLHTAFARAIESVKVPDLEHPEMRRWRGLQ